MTERTITDVLDANTPTLMAIPGVVGTGLGEAQGTSCIVIFVRKKSARLKRQLPAQLEGHPVRVDEVGDIGPLK